MLRFLGGLFAFVCLTVVVGIIAVFAALYHFGQGLPDYRQLADYQPPVVTRIHAGDGRLLAEYAREKRIFVPVKAMPPRVLNAFIAAEDKTFYQHAGLDVFGIIRAMVTNIQTIGSGRRPIGASTITQQVAKNFLLSGVLSYERKIKEAILALRIEKTFSKERIIELYLNEIYLGFGSYGVAAAALNYFNKSLDELTLSEIAYLAGLPKAPNSYHPLRRYDNAIARRNYVIGRMFEDGYITAAEVEIARREPLVVRERANEEFVRADYFAEEVRRQLAEQFGDQKLYDGGLSVRTSLNPRMAEMARRALQDGLIDYDRRRGWRGAPEHLPTLDNWVARLAVLPTALGPPEWRYAVVLKVAADYVEIGLPGGVGGRIDAAGLAWARGGRSLAQLVKQGDIIAVSPVADTQDRFALEQVPKVEGAIIALDPFTGRVLAMEGGFNQARSEFNRATQAWRQPGSSFKPFVYLAALERDMTPSTLVDDAPVEIDQGPGLGIWRPDNYGDQYYGPTPLRVGIEKSRNIMTVRIAQHIGPPAILDMATRFGVNRNLPPVLSIALGTGEVLPINMVAAYGMLVNGGKKIKPTLIDRIQDRHGVTIFRQDQRPCTLCGGEYWREDRQVPALPDLRAQIVDTRIAYQMVHILEGVVQRGTAASLLSLNRPLAGKTGTTNDGRDAWFVGFSPDLVAGVYVGFDEPESLGGRETGGSVAVPIFKEFMANALRNTPTVPFRTPPGIRLVRVNPQTGAESTDAKGTIWEAFLPGTEPGPVPKILSQDGLRIEPVSDALSPENDAITDPVTPVGSGTGGLY
jgi:penicillin-binding protein 1A